MSRDYRILILGDHNAGKTSLINTFLKDVPYVPETSSSTSKPTPCLPVVSVPALHGGTLYIVDSPESLNEGKSGDNAVLSTWHQREVDRADAVVLVCTTQGKEKLESTSSRWLDALRLHASSSKRRAGRHLPLILAVSKTDLDVKALEQLDVQRKYPEVEQVVACSSVRNSNVPEGELTYLTGEIYANNNFSVFWHAQQAIEAPLYPLYDADNKDLRAPAEQAFNRIFALLARRDKHLRPADIQELQYRVFQQHITASELDILMEQILNVTQEGSSTVRLSRENFHTFILSFLARKPAEPVWRILRYYGYDTQLSLAKTYLHPRLAVAPDGSESVELSEAGLSFVAQIWEDFHNELVDGDVPTLADFLESLSIDSDLAARLASSTSLEDFVGKCQSIAAIDTNLMLETMARLGYPQAGPIEDVQTPKKGQPGYRNVLGSIKTINRTKGVRKVFIALLFGDTESREGFSQLAGEAVHLGQGNYFLIVPVNDMAQLSTRRLAQADLAIYAYMETNRNEKSPSIDYLVSLREAAPSKLLDVPSLVVGFRPGTSSEKSEKNPESIVWEASQEAIDFCIAARLDPPLQVGSLDILKTELAKRANARRRASEKAAGSSSWFLWSSALVAGMAAGYVLLQRTGLLLSANKYIQDKS